jgi:UDPglucose 6-dehydrogenase
MDRFRREHELMAVHLFESPCELAENCDALVLITEWNDYRDLDWELVAKKMRNPFILDGRHILDREKLVRAGMRYSTIS